MTQITIPKDLKNYWKIIEKLLKNRQIEKWKMIENKLWKLKMEKKKLIKIVNWIKTKIPTAPPPKKKVGAFFYNFLSKKISTQALEIVDITLEQIKVFTKK